MDSFFPTLTTAIWTIHWGNVWTPNNLFVVEVDMHKVKQIQYYE